MCDTRSCCREKKNTHKRRVETNAGFFAEQHDNDILDVIKYIIDIKEVFVSFISFAFSFSFQGRSFYALRCFCAYSFFLCWLVEHTLHLIQIFAAICFACANANVIVEYLERRGNENKMKFSF